MNNTQTCPSQWQSWKISNELKEVLTESNNVILPTTRDELIELSTNGKEKCTYPQTAGC